MSDPQTQSDAQHIETINDVAEECADDETPAAAISIQLYDELNGIEE